MAKRSWYQRPAVLVSVIVGGMFFQWLDLWNPDNWPAFWLAVGLFPVVCFVSWLFTSWQEQEEIRRDNEKNPKRN